MINRGRRFSWRPVARRRGPERRHARRSEPAADPAAGPRAPCALRQVLVPAVVPDMQAHLERGVWLGAAPTEDRPRHYDHEHDHDQPG